MSVLIVVGLATITTRIASSAEDHSAHQSVAEHEHHHHPSTNDANSSTQPTESEQRHIAPSPPQHAMGEMSNARMIELMQMEDDATIASVMLDEFEYRDANDAERAQAWDLHAWYGDDYNKLWVKTAGEHVSSDESMRLEVLWDRIATPWWSLQAGVRQDITPGPSRTWAVVGVQGIAPYFFDTEASLYVSEQGRTAIRVSSEYDALITQRLILQPQLELEWFGKEDEANRVGSGLSTLELGLRLRYELRRELAPYVGLLWERKFGATADLARADGQDTKELMWVAGIRAWY